MAPSTSPFDVDIEETAARIRDVNHKMITATKQAGLMSLDAYERTMAGLLDYGQKVVDSAGVEQLSDIARSQAGLVGTVTSAYAQAVRELLK
ncbi:hypothetical protein [Mycolicibacterium sp.]|uniref:hypothetical protein n=1 Tax=Mycolicibacterium sp. TaxID=2320850 RepID=UPI0037C60D61